MRTTGIHQRLFQARERAQLTVRALADAAKVSTTTIIDTEHGRRVPGADTLERLAVASRTCYNVLVVWSWSATLGCNQWILLKQPGS